MKIFAFLFFIGLTLSAAHAQSTGGSMQSAGGSGMTMPTCKAGDPVVGVNTQTKMYMTRSQMQSRMGGMSPAQRQTTMQKHHVKLMCKSDAEAMGAKPMTGAGQ